MKILIYMLDASRRSDWLERDNPYMKEVEKLCSHEEYYTHVFFNYYSQFPSTYRWFISTFNQTDNLESLGYPMNQINSTGRNPLKNSLFRIKAEELGLKMRFTHLTPLDREDYMTHNPNHMLAGWMDPISPVDLGNEDDIIDFVYDTSFHDTLWNDRHKIYKNSILQKDEIIRDSFEVSKKLFNMDLFKKYDQIWIMSDHGYADYTPDYWQHDMDKYGNPDNHSNAMLMVISRNNMNYPRDSYVSNVDIPDLILEGKYPNREKLVIYGYDPMKLEYPKYYWILDHYFVTLVDMTSFESYESERSQYQYMNKNFIQSRMTKKNWDYLWITVPWMNKLFEYDFYDKRWL